MGELRIHLYSDVQPQVYKRVRAMSVPLAGDVERTRMTLANSLRVTRVCMCDYWLRVRVANASSSCMCAQRVRVACACASTRVACASSVCVCEQRVRGESSVCE